MKGRNTYEEEIPRSKAAIAAEPSEDLDLPVLSVKYEDFPKSATYKPDDYVMAAAYFVILGNTVKVSKYTGIPGRTIRSWTGQDWWKELVREVRKAKQDELDSKLTKIIMTASDKLEDRVLNGDTLVVQGDLTQVPLKAMDIAKVLGILYDKRALLRGDPTSRTETTKDSASIMRELQEKFADMAKEMLPKPIQGEVVFDEQPTKNTTH